MLCLQTTSPHCYRSVGLAQISLPWPHSTYLDLGGIWKTDRQTNTHTNKKPLGGMAVLLGSRPWLQVVPFLGRGIPLCKMKSEAQGTWVGRESFSPCVRDQEHLQCRQQGAGGACPRHLPRKCLSRRSCNYTWHWPSP